MLQNISIGLFIDGGYFVEVSKEAQRQGLKLGVKQLLNFCRGYLSAHYGLNEDDCHITEKHFYRGRYYANAAKELNLLGSERAFEDTMISHDVVFHYKHVRQNPNNPDLVIEKGIDVWFALDTYEMAIARDLDIVVIVTGDGDHEMLLNKIKALKKKAVLLTYNMAEVNSVSRLLREEASLHIELSDVLSDSSEYMQYFK